jgi:glycosyltransferase involved in cell wall biosynthesis
MMAVNRANPLVSVVTVVLNSRDFLVRTIESVSAQDYNNIECIVVDGGSSDGTEECLNSYSDVVTSFISEPDGGIYDAMNKGLGLCSKDSVFVVFMNAGDVFCDEFVVSEAMRSIDSVSCHLYGDVVRNNQRIRAINRVNLYTLSTNMICHQSILFLTASLRKIPYDIKYKLCADYKLLIELILRGECFRYMDMPFAVFEGSGISNQQRGLLHFEKKQIRRQYPRLYLWNRMKTCMGLLKR